MNILVTGGAGHIGSHVIEQLLKDPDNTVISLDNYFTGKVTNHIPGAVYRKGSTKDIERLIPETIDILYHLGEYARTAPSFEEPYLVHDLNIRGTFAVLEYWRRHDCKLVYAASSTRFSNESNPYSLSKASNVDLINNYAKWYSLDYAICYFYNAFGPRENGNGKYATLIAKCEYLYQQSKSLPINRPGTQRRNFTYVGDLAAGFILAGEKGFGDGYAFNNLKAYSVIEIAEAFNLSVSYTENYSGRQDTDIAPLKGRALGWTTTVDIMDYIKTLRSTSKDVSSRT